METFLYVLHIALSFVIVIVVLLQSGKGGGLGAGFSSAAAMGQEVFGGRGAASFLGKLTWVLGFTFMATSMGLAWYSSQPRSALDLDMQADEPIEQVVHTVIDEGGTAGDLPDDFMQQLEGMDAEDLEGLDLQMQQDGGEQPPIDVEMDEGMEMPEELQQQLEEMEEQLSEPGAEPAEPMEMEVDQEVELEELDVDEEVEPAEEAEVEEETQPAQESEVPEEDAPAEDEE